jgi:hypothetical protein
MAPEDELVAPEEDCLCPPDDPEELAPILLPVDLFCPGGVVCPIVPDAEGAGVAAFDGVVERSLPFLAPEDDPAGL